MMTTPFYAIFFAILFLVLSVRAILARRGARIPIGARGNKTLERAMRVHANFAEYVPFILLLAAFAEARGTASGVIHGICLVLLAGRLCHAWGVSHENEDLRLRVPGMMLTLASLIGATLTLIISYLQI